MMGRGPMTLSVRRLIVDRARRENDDVRAGGCASNEADGADGRERWTKRTWDDDADGAQKL